jgi:restriction system protein
MDLNVDILSVLNFFLPTIFAFWPVFVIAPFTWKHTSISKNLVVWVILVLVRISIVFLDGSGLSLIPEPLSTILFLFAGILLFIIYFVRRRGWLSSKKLMRLSLDSVNDFHQLEPDEFELVVARVFKTMGHNVSLSGGQGDHGVDLVVRAKNGEQWIVQCKNWKGSIGEPTIRDLFGVLHHLHADRAALVTSGTFTDQAVKWASGKPIDLIAGKRLLEIWRKVTGA